MKKLKLNVFDVNRSKNHKIHPTKGKGACRTRMVVLPGSTKSIPPVEPETSGHVHTDASCCRNHMVVLPGYGAAEYPFPTVEQVVTNACKSFAKKAAQASARRRAQLAEQAGGDAQAEGGADDDASDTCMVTGHHDGTPSLNIRGKSKKELASELPSTPVVVGSGATLFAAAEGFRVIFHNGRFEAIVAEKFDRLTGAVNWARNHMAPKYQPAIESLDRQLTKLQDIYREALPKIIDFLAAQNPQASRDELLQAAVEVVDEQLAQILYVLSIWTDAFGQFRDGTYEELQAVIFTVEQAYHLFRTGDITGACDEECQKRLKARVFGVEDVFVARFSGHGPATIPGSRGPVGAHAIEVPHDERDIITLMLVLYLHEFRHDIFHDVEGLAEEVLRVVVEAIDKAHADGKFKFSSPTIKLGNQKVNTIDIVKKVFADTVSEVDADIAGGVLLSGPAFLYNMLATFSAFNAKDNGVFNQDTLLRSGSVYEVDEKGGLHFEVHMPDYMRAYVVASALDLLDFKTEAAECRGMADQAAGVPLPKEITWQDAEGKRKMVIKIACDDLRQVAPVVAEALIKTPLASLGGVSMERIVNWTKRRQAKAELLAQNLMAGKSDVPTDKGDFYATYVAAASTLAYFGLVKAGMHPIHAARQVEANSPTMLDEVRRRVEAQAAAAVKAPAPAPAPAPSPAPGDGAGEKK